MKGYAMTWTSDRTGILLYTMLGTLLVLSSIYVPAVGAVRDYSCRPRRDLQPRGVAAECLWRRLPRPAFARRHHASGLMVTIGMPPGLSITGISGIQQLTRGV